MDKTNAREPGFGWKTGMDAVYLLSCALHGCTPDLSQISDLDGLYRYCASHSVAAMVAMALDEAWKMDPPDDPSVMAAWKQAKDKSIRKNILLNAERQRILAYLDSIGCWYLPLKGSSLQHDYPKFGMRQMGDNDILYDVVFAEQLRDFMCENGYAVKAFGENYHDEYTKEPVYNFEMHRSLFAPLPHKVFSTYYADIYDHLIKDSNNAQGYHMADEDFYAYFIAHAYTHFSANGTGIRTLLDVYVFLNKHGDTMDRDYLETELEKLGLLQYERQCRDLAKKLFGQPSCEIALTEEEGNFLSKFLGAGTYGNKQQRIDNLLERLNENGSSRGVGLKLRYFWYRLFPPFEYMASMEPELVNKPWKLPLSYLKRLMKAVFDLPKLAIQESRYLSQRRNATEDPKQNG